MEAVEATRIVKYVLDIHLSPRERRTLLSYLTPVVLTTSASDGHNLAGELADWLSGRHGDGESATGHFSRVRNDSHLSHRHPNCASHLRHEFNLLTFVLTNCSCLWVRSDPGCLGRQGSPSPAVGPSLRSPHRSRAEFRRSGLRLVRSTAEPQLAGQDARSARPDGARRGQSARRCL